ncbi:TonB-dependent receptor [Erythrobacter sp.]|uniref:TonB-dependent receptor n=1 Tax=Erythrobacter sp. TaxID=1042 RepID=UPI003296D139
MSNFRPAKKLKSRLALFTILTPAVVVFPVNSVSAQEAAEESSNENLIIVTARGREETLLEAPVSVSVQTQEQLDTAGISDIENLSAYTPGFTFENSDGQAGGRSSSSIQFRGIRQQAGGAASRTGGIFFDGSFISQGAGLVQFIDVERVEVIKGPQVAYFPRNTFSGAVNFVPKLPGDELEVHAELEGSVGTGTGEQASYRAVAAIGGPITDSIGLRVASSYERRGADYQYANGDPNGEEDTFSIFGTAVFDVTQNFQVKATGYFVDSKDTTNAQGVSATTAPGDCNQTFNGATLNGITGVESPFSTDLSNSTITIFCGQIPDAAGFTATATGDSSGGFFSALPGTITPFVDNQPDGLGNEYLVWRANLSAEFETAGGHQIRGFVTRGESELSSLQDLNYGLFFNNTFAFANFTRDSFAELRFSSNRDERLRFEVGVNYYEQEFRNGNAFVPADFQDNEAFGIFATLDYDITDALTFSFEGRWVDDTQSILDATETTTDENSFQDFMPRAILSYSPNRDLNIYASFTQSSLNSVITNVDAVLAVLPDAIPNPEDFGSFTGVQRVDAFEIGLKKRVADWLNFSISAYYLEWDNQPFGNTFTGVDVGGNPAIVSANLDGESEYTGVDFEVTFTPTDGLQIFGSVGWVDADLVQLGSAGSVSALVLCPSAFTSTVPCTAFADAGVNTLSGSGNSPANVSEWSGAVGASYAFPIPTGELYLRGDALYQGSRFVDNFAYNQIGSSWKVNLRAGADVTDNLRIEAFVENLFQDDTLQNAGATGASFFAPNGGGFTRAFTSLPDRREVGMRLTADF